MKISNLKFVLCCVLVLFVMMMAGCKKSEGTDGTVLEKPEKVVPVNTEVVKKTDLKEHFILPASLEANEDLILSAEIAGPVKKINFKEGARVDKGAVLLEIDADTLRSHLASDEQNYQVLNRKLKRYRGLAKEGLVSSQELENLENAVTAAESALQTTRLQLAKCYPKAPVSGLIDERFVDRGEYVDPGKPLIHLVQIDKLKAIADVPEKDISYLHVGQEVEIIPANINGLIAKSLTGRIDFIAYAANDTTRTYRTRILVDNVDGLLRPGMIVRARFVRQHLQDVLAVPLYAVVDRDGEKLVFVVENGRAQKINVETGPSVGQRIVITSGLEAGQQLVVKGQQLLIDGARLEVQEN